MCLCGILPRISLSLTHTLTHTHTHTHTRSHPLGPSEKHARLLLGNPLHTGASILTLNTCICVFGVLPFILLTVKLNFQNSSAHAEEDGSGKKGGDEWTNEARGERGWFCGSMTAFAPPFNPHPPCSARPLPPVPHPKNVLILIHIPPKPFSSSPPQPKKYHHPRLPVNKALSTTPPQLNKKKKKKPKKDNKGKVLRPNKRREINTLPRDLPLSHCHPPQ